MTGPLNALTQSFVQIVNFSGRATRSEFWWVFGLVTLIGLVAGVADALMLMRLVETSGEAALARAGAAPPQTPISGPRHSIGASSCRAS